MAKPPKTLYKAAGTDLTSKIIVVTGIDMLMDGTCGFLAIIKNLVVLCSASSMLLFNTLRSYIFADILIEAVERTGTDLNVDNLITSLETIKDYEDPLQTGSVTFSETRRQGTNISYFFQVQEERFKVISGPIAY